MKGISNVAVSKLLQGNQVGPNNACVLNVVMVVGLFPPEGLAGGEGEGQREFRFGQVEGYPFGGLGALLVGWDWFGAGEVREDVSGFFG